MILDPNHLEVVAQAANDKNNVSGYTHDFYNYPARFSPVFVKEIIKTFTKPGDLVCDPFMGGGTTLVESKILQRNCIGFDISTLAYFLSKVKTTSLLKKDIKVIHEWQTNTLPGLKCRGEYERPLKWIEAGYHKNLSEKDIWPIRVLMEKYISMVESLSAPDRIKNFLRTALLKSGQWALDSKKIIPSADEFRDKVAVNIDAMLATISSINDDGKKIRIICRNKPAECVHKEVAFKKLGAPRLIVTSPPYPGVHVMYHRWQIKGRRETPAPFWIANSKDGHGLSHYAMGGRHEKELKTYYNNILKSFSSIAQVCDNETLVVQMIAFSDLSWQLDKYLLTMEEAGFEEVSFFDSRLWRDVPNRKWYAEQKGTTSGSKEVVLFHKKSTSTAH